MKILRDNTQIIEEYLFDNMKPQQNLFFEACLVLYPSLRSDVFFQKKVYRLLKFYNRKKLREKIEGIHQSVFSNKKYRDEMYNIFK